MSKDVTKFLAGSLFGVCIAVALFCLRGPVASRLAEEPAAAQEASRDAKIALRPDDSVLGDRKAPLTLVEYSDFECPFCVQFNLSSFPGDQEKLHRYRKLRFVHRNLPLPMHSNARAAAQAVLCAMSRVRIGACDRRSLPAPSV